MAEETNCDVESKAAQQGVVSMFVELFPGSNSYCVRLRVVSQCLSQKFVSNGKHVCLKWKCIFYRTEIEFAGGRSIGMNRFLEIMID